MERFDVVFSSRSYPRFTLPQEYYKNSSYVLNVLTPDEPKDNGDSQSPQPDSPRILCIIVLPDEHARVLQKNYTPTSFPELYNLYNVFVHYDFDTDYVQDCLFFRLFISETREDPMLEKDWTEPLFNIANLLSSDEHRKLYSYPKMDGENYDAKKLESGQFVISLTNKTHDKDGEELDPFEYHRGSPGTPNWKKYVQFVANMKTTDDPAKLARNFINDFLDVQFDFEQIGYHELLPIILRSIRDPAIHNRLMSNYRTYHFYLSDPELFKHIRTPRQVARIYKFMMIQELMAYISGSNIGVAMIELGKFLQLVEIHNNAFPLYYKLSTHVMDKNYDKTLAKDIHRDSYFITLMETKYESYLKKLPPMITRITNIPGVALTGSRMTELFCDDSRPFLTSDYDIMILATAPSTFDSHVELILDILYDMAGPDDRIESTRTEKKVGIKYGRSIIMHTDQPEPIRLDVFAVPDFDRAILSFHTGPVRLYLTGGKIYMLPSAADCLLNKPKMITTGIRYIAGGASNPLAIIKKQYNRGFKFIMASFHMDIINAYLSHESE